VHEASRQQPRIIPHPRIIEGYLRNLLAFLDSDVDRAREILARHMPPLVLTPDGRTYRVTGGFHLNAVIDDDPPEPGPGGSGTVGRPPEVRGNQSRLSRLLQLPQTWLPVETVIR
jgi:hypothetical protein